ncbi:OmpA family protein [Flocculibacter collagenilyticus]|uniref:OmpA family protein n=1 Tax=Flocculibacter collagenilyticus TaxID=2744479 RepID=UPI0018F30456|nr:OmpA family protein [Flocculibacter collagenilyticus]
MYRHRNKHTKVDEDNLDRWLVSYADYMTLMFALFVVLYALSLIKEEEYKILSDTLGEVFEIKGGESKGAKNHDILVTEQEDTDFQLYGDGLLEVKGPELLESDSQLSNIHEKKLGNPLAALEQDLKTALHDLEQKGIAEVERDDDWLTIELNSGMLFPSASSTTTNNAKLVLSQISKIIEPVNNYIRVRGYTDNIPINNEIYSSNWELSVARATAVVREFQSSGLNPARMAIEGYGEYYPFADNSTAQGRANNRKVVIAVSKYALDVPLDEENDSRTEMLKQLVSDVQATQQQSNEGAESEQENKVRIIQLPNGGIRVTTAPEENATENNN